MRRNWRFQIGMFFLIVNFPLGYGGVAVCGILAAKTGRVAFYSALGTACYVVSWILFGLGILLAGKEGVALSKQLMRRMLGRKSDPSVGASSVGSDPSAGNRDTSAGT